MVISDEGVFLFHKECPTLEKKDTEYHQHNDSNRIINATFCSQSS